MKKATQNAGPIGLKKVRRFKSLTIAVFLCFSGGLLLLAPTGARGQTTNCHCAPEPAIRQALATITGDPDRASVPSEQYRQERASQIKKLLNQYPDDLFLHRSYQAARTRSLAYDPEPLLSEYRALLAQHPGNPVYLYLYSRVLIEQGRKLSEAETNLKTALKLDPNFAPAHLSLLTLYQNKPNSDKGIITGEAEAFMKLCPTNFNDYFWIARVDNEPLKRAALARLYAEKEKTAATGLFPYYTTLWDIEFSLRPTNEHSQLRQEIKVEIDRLRQLDLEKETAWAVTLIAGYKRINDPAGVTWAEDKILANFLDTRTALRIVVNRWLKDHPYPKAGAPADEAHRFAQQYRQITEEWIRQWPKDITAWTNRFSAVLYSDDLPASEVEATLVNFKNVLDQNPGAIAMHPPLSFLIAQQYLRRNIRLTEVENLITQSIAEDVDSYNMLNQREDYDEQIKRSSYDNLQSSYWQAWPVLLEAQLKLNRPQKAREVIGQMEKYLASNQSTDKDSEATKTKYAEFKSVYWEWQGRIAESEKRSVDALTCYQNALSLKPKEAGSTTTASLDLIERAKRLWQVTGGTDLGWQSWLSAQGKEAVLQANDPNRWESSEKALPNFALKDLQGRSWKLSDLKGKVTLINMWATWCGPCRAELPYLQKLADKLKDRTDIQVLTLNADSEIGLVEPFVKQTNLNLTVIPALSYITGLYPQMAIPYTLIVSPDGVAVYKKVGFTGDGNKWIDDTVKLLEQSRRLK